MKPVLTPHPRPCLTDRERDVARLAMAGKTSAEIGVVIGISKRTVDFHLANLYEKLQVRNRVELVLKMNALHRPIEA